MARVARAKRRSIPIAENQLPPQGKDNSGARFALQCGLGIALIGSALLVDPRAEASFDAPKRVCAIIGALVALGAVCGEPRGAGRMPRARIAAWACICAALAMVWILIATVFSPHQDMAWNSLRRAAFFALFVPIGASRAFAAAGTRVAVGAFAFGTVANVVVSLAQAAGWKLPLDVVQLGGRFATGALLGNEGYVALAAALLACICVVVMMRDSRRRYRVAAAAALAASVAAIVVNHQATSAIALAAALMVAAAAYWRLRWLSILLGVGIVVAVTTVLLPPLRHATWAALGSVDAYQQLTTYRLGAWVSALHMIQIRPLLGFGLGSFALEQQTHRFAAEISLQQRFVQPTGSSFIYAHDDYLQLAAEAGLPALLFLLGGVGAIVLGLARLGRSSVDGERLVLLALLTCGAVAALAWFPLQIPFIAVALLLAIGRAWRLVADGAVL